jgi:hypothetical protein
MTAFADQADVEAALGRDLTAAEEATVDTLLEEATDLLLGYLGCTPDPVPEAVTRVCARMVARVYAQAAAVEAPIVGASQMQQTAGPFSRSTSFGAGSTSGSAWLSASDKITLRPYRCGGGFKTISVESVQSGKYRRYTGT